MTTRRRLERLTGATGTNGKAVLRPLIPALGLMLFALLAACSKEESCGSKCREAYEECLTRAGGDADAAFDCGEQRTNCLSTCVPGSTFAVTAPESDEVPTAPEDSPAGNDDCPCKKTKQEGEARQAEENGKSETPKVDRSSPVYQ